MKKNKQTPIKNAGKIQYKASLRKAVQRRGHANDTSLIPGVNIEELKHNLDLLKYALDYAEGIIETIREPILILDKDLRVLTANPSFYRTFQVHPKSTENCLIYELGNGQWDIPKLKELLEEILPQNSYFDNFAVDHTFPGIGRRHMLVNARRIIRAINSTPSILLTFEDITEQYLAKQKEETVKRSEERYRLIAKATNDAIWDWDLVANTVLWNEAIETVFGYRKKDVHEDAHWWYEHIHPDDRESVVEGIHKVIDAGGESWSDEYRFQKADGTYKYVFDRGYIIHDEKGESIRMIGSMFDLSERKESEEALKKSRERQDIMLQATEVGLWYCDLPFDELIWDDKVKEHFWLPHTARVTIDTFYEQIHPDDRERTRKAIDDSNQNHTIYDIEYRTVNKKDGKIKWIRAIGRTFYDKNDKPIRFDGVTIDVTDRKELERQKDDFIGMASHELKTPVTSIKAYTQVLQYRFKKAEDIKSEEMVAKMDSQLDKLSSLISDLLDITKVESGKLQFNEKFFDFNELVNEIVEELQRTTLRHKITTKLAKSKSIFGDRDRIGQVITNFLTNAIKYSPHSQDIIVSTTADKNFIKLSVQDFGNGIAKEQQAKVFERFHRVVEKGEETYPGLGLGLYISSEIIRRHDGQIGVESKIGKGSTFYFIVPLNKKTLSSKRKQIKQK